MAETNMMTLDDFLSEWHNDDERLLVHTSGSTGTPKPLWVEKRRMLASARMTCDFLGLKAGDVALLCLPLDYIAGKMMVVRALERGLQLLNVEPGGHPLANHLQLTIPHFQLSLVAMVPLQVWNSLQVPEERERLRQVKHLLIGGGPVNDALADALKDFPNAIWSTYGMTETLSHIALRRLNGPERSEWYTPLPGVDLSLSADGCLVVDAPSVCAHSLLTNDLADIERGGAVCRFRISGRRDNVVCSGGVKIQIEDVERRLKPWIRVPFLMTKRPDERLGEAIVMLIERNDAECPSPPDALTIENCKTLCRKVLQKYEQPRDYRLVDRLPMTETGKPARREAERLAAVSASE